MKKHLLLYNYLQILFISLSFTFDDYKTLVERWGKIVDSKEGLLTLIT